MNRATLRLSSRQQAIVASEDKLLKIAAGVLIPEPEEEVEPEAPLMNEKLPYAQVCGVDGVAFVQGKNYFNRSKRLVAEAPEPAWYIVEPPKPAGKAEARSAAVREVLKLPDTPRVPKAVADAEKENAQALAAENLAE